MREKGLHLEILRIKKYSVIFSIAWFLVIICSLFWNLYNEGLHVKEIAKSEAISSFNKDHAVRMWASQHGGVYVPIDDRTPANPKLSHIKDRNIIKPNGDTLTLMNPAYIIRQMFSEFPEKYGIKGHIVSLKPLNPDNSPDGWEREALLKFEMGVSEVYEFIEKDKKNYLRLIRPLITMKSCLKCHASQGYKVGDIRGGISVTVSIAHIQATANIQERSIALLHFFLFFVGFISIEIAKKRFIKGVRKRENIEELFLNAVLKAPNPIMIHDEDNRVLQLSSGWIKYSGYTIEDIPTLGDWTKRAYGTKSEFAKDYIEKLFEINETVNNGEWSIRTKEGETRIWDFSTTPIGFNEDGKKILLSIATDITDRKEAELSLKQSVHELTTLNKLGNQVGKVLSPTKVVRLALDNIIGSLQSDLLLFFLLEEDDLLLKEAKFNNPKFKHKDTPVHKVGECMCGLAIREKKAMYSINITKDARCTWSECKKAGLISFAAIPLFMEGKIIGVLGFGSATEFDYSKHARFLQTISNQIAISLQNAILFEQLKDHASKLEQEIVERKRGEKLLEKSEQRLLKAQNVSGVGFLDFNLRTNEIELSEEVVKIYGLNPETKWVNSDFVEKIVHVDDIEKVRENLELAIKNEKRYDIEHRIVRPDGEIRWVHAQADLSCDAEGNITKLLGTIIDITKSKLDGIALRENKEVLSKITENFPNSFVSIVEKDFTISFTSGQEYRNLDLDFEQYLGLSIENIWGDNSNFILEEYSKTFNGEERSFELCISELYQLFRTVPLISEDGSINRILTVVENITDRKNIEKELANYRSHLEELVGVKTKELEEKNIELEEINDVFIGRESRIIELKEEIVLLKKNLKIK